MLSSNSIGRECDAHAGHGKRGSHAGAVPCNTITDICTQMTLDPLPARRETCIVLHATLTQALSPRQASVIRCRPSLHMLMAQVNALSPDGRCKAFDAAADGYGRGEGVAVAVLQPFSGHEEGTGRATLALLTGSAVNQDGRSSSLTVSAAQHIAIYLVCYAHDYNQVISSAALHDMPAHSLIPRNNVIQCSYCASAGSANDVRTVQAPHGPSQTALILTAVAAADEPALSFVAAHGTGTPLGDPIETGALCKAATVLQRGNGSAEAMQPQTITVGGVKTLLGHTEGTAGIAGLLLAVAVGTHGSAMPLRYRSLNPFVAASLDGNGHSACRLPLQVRSPAVLRQNP